MTEKRKKWFKKIIFISHIFKTNNFDWLQEVYVLKTKISQIITNRTKLYYNRLSKKLNDPLTTPKIYPSILRMFYNGIKIPLIPPLIINNRVTKNFRRKSNFFFNIFLLHNVPPLSMTLSYHHQCSTEQKIGLEEFLLKMRMLWKLSGHSHDILIRSIETCDVGVVRPWSLPFKNFVQWGISKFAGKKSKIVPVHKKEDKQYMVKLLSSLTPSSM